MAPARTPLMFFKDKPDRVSLLLCKEHRPTPAPSLRRISVILRQLLHRASRVKAKRLSIQAEVGLGFLLFLPTEDRDFSLLPSMQTSSKRHPVFRWYRFFFRELSGRGVKVTTLFHLNQSLRTSGAMPLLSILLHDVNRHNFASNLILRQNHFILHS